MRSSLGSIQSRAFPVASSGLGARAVLGHRDAGRAHRRRGRSVPTSSHESNDSRCNAHRLERPSSLAATYRCRETGTPGRGVRGRRPSIHGSRSRAGERPCLTPRVLSTGLPRAGRKARDRWIRSSRMAASTLLSGRVGFHFDSRWKQGGRISGGMACGRRRSASVARARDWSRRESQVPGRAVRRRSASHARGRAAASRPG